MTGFYEVIKLNYDRLNDTEKEMCSYLADHLEELADLSINDMAKMLQSSRSSVLRMAQKLGYRGYSEMKYEMKLAAETAEVVPANLEEQFRKDVSRTFDLLEQVNFMPLLQAMEQADHLIIYATGFVQNNYSKQLSSLNSRPKYPESKSQKHNHRMLLTFSFKDFSLNPTAFVISFCFFVIAYFSLHPLLDDLAISILFISLRVVATVTDPVRTLASFKYQR